jgi:phage baseplate assembly protein W
VDEISHLALPLRLVGSSYAAVAQDSSDELTTTVAVICAFPVGYRAERPEFGVPPPELSDEPLDLAAIQRAVGIYEPRAVATVLQAPAGTLGARIQVLVSMANEEEEQIG